MPNTSPFGSLMQGMASGFNMYAPLIQRNREAQREADQKKLEDINKRKQDLEKRQLKTLEIGMRLLSDKDIPDAMKIRAYNSMVPTFNKFMPDAGMTSMDEWPKHGNEYAKKVLNVWNNKDYTLQSKKEIIAGLSLEAQSVGKPIDISAIEKIKEPKKPATAMADYLQKHPNATSEEVATYKRSLAKETKPVSAKTAMAAFLQQKPNATPDEIAAFSQKLKGKGFRMTTADGTIIEFGGGKGGKLPISAQEKLNQLKDVRESAVALRKLYNPSYTGPIQARLQKLKSIVFSNEKFQGFKATLGQLRAFVYALSGKQINETEIKWLKEEILPQLEQPDANFQATLDTLDKWIARKYAASSSAYKDVGYNVGGTPPKAASHKLDKYMVK